MVAKKDEKSIEVEKALDLAQLSTEKLCDEGVWLTLEHPITGEPLPARIRLAGIDSKIYQQQIRKNQNKRLKRFRFKMSSEEIENERLNLLAAITLEWEGVVENGQALECNTKNARHVYATYPWIREQVDEFAGDRANFIKS